LEKRPRNRFSNMGEVVKELDRIVHFTQTGSIDVVPSNRSGEPASVLADALEAPSTEELQIAMRRAGVQRRSALPALLLAFGAIGLGLALGWAVLDDEPVAAEPQPAVVTANPPQPRVQPLPVPDPEPEFVEASNPENEEPLPPAAYSQPKAAPRVGMKQHKAASPPATEPAPARQQPRKRATRAGDIIDPWAE
jgi:hypothetical protein